MGAAYPRRSAEPEDLPEVGRGSTTVRRASGSGRLAHSSFSVRSEVEKRETRLVEEAHAPYEEIEALVRALSGKYGVTLQPVPQMTRREGHVTRAPHFFAERKFLLQRVPNIRFPKTVQFRDYKEDPSEKPVVMKDETVSRGERKFLIENSHQLERFRAWMKKHGNEEHWLAQEFIETPGSAPSSLRILVDCTGHILTSQINYGLPHKRHARKDDATPEKVAKDSAKLLELPSSKFFLNARALASNEMLLGKDDTTIGGRITLDPLPISHPYSPAEVEMIKAYGLDPTYPMLPQLPKEAARIASGIGQSLRAQQEQVYIALGIDIVQREGTEEFHVLEVNRRPSMAPIRDMFGSANSIKEMDAWRYVINGALRRMSGMR